MNAYRVALILCRAVVITLWWTAGLRFLSGAIMFGATQLNIGGMKSVPLTTSLYPLIDIVLTVVTAGFLQTFAASIATSITGNAAFEGDSIGSPRDFDADERALGRAGGGLFLLCFGAANAIPWIISILYVLFFGGLGSGVAASYSLFSFVSSLIPTVLECLVGFVLAFSLGLRRLVKPQ